MNKETDTPQQVIVFGGSFNPPTRAHECIMHMCLEQPQFAEVWVMPSGDRDDKQMSSGDDERIAMLESMKTIEFNANPRLHISDFELQLPRPTQTIRTVGALATSYPDKKFWFVYGADSYASMPEWEDGQELQRQLAVLLLPRPGAVLPPESETVRHMTGEIAEVASVSSTQVREAVASSQNIESFVSQSVWQYITKSRLYTTA